VGRRLRFARLLGWHLDGHLTMDRELAATSDMNEGRENEPQEARIGLSKKPEAEIAREIISWWKESLDRHSERRKIAKRCHKMVDGDQWEQIDKQRAESQRRPALTFDLLSAMLAAVEGQERNNRQDMRYYGVGKEDDQAASNWTKLLKWVIELNGGDYEITQQFREMLITGEGWITPVVDYFDDPEGCVMLEFIEGDEVFDDPLSKKPMGTDARWRLRVKMLTEDEGEALFPGKFTKAIHASAAENGTIQETDGKGYPDIYLAQSTEGPKRYDAKDQTWAVIQAFWWEIEDAWHCLNDETGLIDELTEEEYQAKKEERRQQQMQAIQLVTSGAARIMPSDPAQAEQAMQQQQQAEMLGLPVVPMIPMPKPLEATKRPTKRIYEAFVVYDSVLEVAPLREKLKVFPIVPMRGTRRKTKMDFTGIIERVIDVQRQHNVEQSIIVQLMQLMPKQSWMGPKGSFHNKQEWESGVAQPGKMLEYNAQRGKPEAIRPPDIPRHIVDMAFTRPQSMREISGVNIELTGVRQGNDAGVVMEQRAKAAQTVLAPLFDNARRTRKMLGKVVLAFMQTHLSPDRQVRILGPESKPEVVQVTPDMLQGRYDFAVDETDSTINDRVATLNIMQTTLPQMMKAGVPIPPGIVDLMPMEPKLREEWKRMIAWQLTLSGALPPPDWEPGMPAPPPPGAPAPGMMPPPQ
jgi:hypothetical protein